MGKGAVHLAWLAVHAVGPMFPGQASALIPRNQEGALILPKERRTNRVALFLCTEAGKKKAFPQAKAK